MFRNSRAERPTYTVKRSEPFRIGRLSLQIKPTEQLLGLAKDDRVDSSDYVKDTSASIVGYPNQDDSDDGYDGNLVTLGHVNAKVVQSTRIENEGQSLWEVCDENSQELAWLLEAFFPEKVTDNGVLPEEYCNGDILLTNEVRLIEQAHGYGVGLLAVDGVLNSLPSLNEGLVVLDPSGLTMDKKAGFDHKATQDKLIKCWGLLGLEVHARKCKRHPTFMAWWAGHTRPSIEDVVPHLIS